jgi:hypothetical protein
MSVYKRVEDQGWKKLLENGETIDPYSQCRDSGKNEIYDLHMTLTYKPVHIEYKLLLTSLFLRIEYLL